MHIYRSNSEITRREQLPNGNGSTLDEIELNTCQVAACVGFTLAMLCFISKHKLCHMNNMSIIVSDCCLFLVLVDFPTCLHLISFFHFLILIQMEF